MLLEPVSPPTWSMSSGSSYEWIGADMLSTVTLNNCDFLFHLTTGVGVANMPLALLASVAAKASLSSLKIANGGNFEWRNA